MSNRRKDSKFTPPKGKLGSPLKWAGGKTPLAEWIISHMPLLGTYLIYVEAFIGGASVLCGMPFGGTSEVINDLYGDVTNFFEVLASPKLFKRFLRRVALLPFSQPLWDKMFALLHSGGGTQVERAVAFFIVNRQSRAGQMKDFATLSKNRTRRQMNEQASAWLSAVDGLKEFHARLQQVVILNQDALQVIKAYDGPKTLFYLDPPYMHATRTSKDLYRFEMTDEQHRELLEVILKCKGKVIISGYHCPLYDELLSGWRCVEREVPNHASGAKTKRKMTECLWMNFPAEEQPPQN